METPKLTPFTLVIAFVMLWILPVLFGQMMFAALEKLYLDPTTATALIFAIIFGGFVNIPIKRLHRPQPVTTHPLTIFGLHHVMPHWRKERQETIIALNVGGCIVPTGLALYEAYHIAFTNNQTLLNICIASGINIIACYLTSKPIPNVGIVMPTMVSPLIAASAALLLSPDQAVPIAFIAGVTGPLIGADLFHLKKIEDLSVGIASIGGAGTFDGIVISGIIAAYLA